jgi:hypothetical protein
MHVERIIDRDRHTIYSTFTGEMTLDEICADLARLATEPGYSSDMSGILDMRKATVKLTAEEFQQLAETIKKHPQVFGRTRRALLVGSDLAFGMFSMFAAFTEEGRTEYRVFRDEKKARDWIEEAVVKRRFGPS